MNNQNTSLVRISDIADMKNIRVFYTKLSRAKYISHLDITRCMQRAINRAGVPAWYTEGFNPHIYITFALPLSLGYESEYECMDMRLNVDMDLNEVRDRLNSALPPDIRVTKVAEQVNKPDKIVSAVYELSLTDESKSGSEILDLFNEFMQSDKIEVLKKSKKGIKTIDIKPDCEIIKSNATENSLTIELKAAAGLEKNINPSLLTDEFIKRYSLDNTAVSVIRKAVFMVDGKEFE